MRLLTSQKDQLFNLIENFKLAPSQFELTENPSKILQYEIATTLTYKNSDFYFVFETGKDSFSPHYAIFSPGTETYIEKIYPGSWEFQLNTVVKWLSNLVREINSPNKWDRLQKEISAIHINYEDDQDKFSATEYEELQKKIFALKQAILTIELLPEQLAAINIKLDHLTDLGKELSKFDWKGLFIGTILTIIIQLTVSPENAKLLWDLIKQIFSNYLLP